MGTERLYCAIFHFPPSETRTPIRGTGPGSTYPALANYPAFRRTRPFCGRLRNRYGGRGSNGGL
jgi:hypothetical protein